jgi:hypothetical protein
MKKILIGIGVIAVLVIGGAYYVFSNLGGIIQEVVEKVGSEATQASVSLGNVDIDITSGSGSLSALKVGNPSGFKTPSAFELGGISLKIDTASIGGDVITIKEIVIADPQITYELAGTDSNVDAIKKNVDAYAKKMGAGGGGSSTSDSGGGETKLVIENLYIRGGKVSVSAGFLDGKALGTDLPDIHLTDIGKDSGGASPAEVAKDIIDSMTKGVGSAVGSLDLDGMMKGATEEATKAVESVTKGVGDAAGGAADSVGGAIKGLLK